MNRGGLELKVRTYCRYVLDDSERGWYNQNISKYLVMRICAISTSFVRMVAEIGTFRVNKSLKIVNLHQHYASDDTEYLEARSGRWSVHVHVEVEVA